MSGRIFLIVEAERDGRYARAIIQRHYPKVEVRYITPGRKQGIGELAKNIERLLIGALEAKGKRDCVAVLHDADETTTPNRNLHQAIAQACRKHKGAVVLVLAKDEIEAWLMADSGVCAWLDRKPKNWDEATQPSETFKSWLDKANKGPYDDDTAAQIAQRLQGDGHQHSPSLTEALRHLNGAVCVQTEDT